MATELNTEGHIFLRANTDTVSLGIGDMPPSPQLEPSDHILRDQMHCRRVARNTRTRAHGRAGAPRLGGTGLATAPGRGGLLPPRPSLSGDAHFVLCYESVVLQSAFSRRRAGAIKISASMRLTALRVRLGHDGLEEQVEQLPHDTCVSMGMDTKA